MCRLVLVKSGKSRVSLWQSSGNLPRRGNRLAQTKVCLLVFFSALACVSRKLFPVCYYEWVTHVAETWWKWGRHVCFFPVPQDAYRECGDNTPLIQIPRHYICCTLNSTSLHLWTEQTSRNAKTIFFYEEAKSDPPAAMNCLPICSEWRTRCCSW
jgi:hypothetical protein